MIPATAEQRCRAAELVADAAASIVDVRGGVADRLRGIAAAWLAANP